MKTKNKPTIQQQFVMGEAKGSTFVSCVVLLKMPIPNCLKEDDAKELMMHYLNLNAILQSNVDWEVIMPSSLSSGGDVDFETISLPHEPNQTNPNNN